MLPGGTDLFYRQILAAGHGHYARVEVWSGSGVQLDVIHPDSGLGSWMGGPEGGLVFLDGSLSASLGSRVSRNLVLNVPGDMYPADENGLLAPFGNELRVFRGVRLGDSSSTYVWQVFRGKIQRVSQSSQGTCTVECSDRAQDVADVGFVSPQNSLAGSSINSEFQRLIVDAVPDATFGASDTFAKAVEPLTWESDRSAALDEMARSVGALWYPLANGDFVLRRFPWNVASSPVITLTDREGGTVNNWSSTRSRDSIFNVVTVTGERLNGDDAVFATASNTTPGSPTNVGGNFGVKTWLERLQTPSSPGGAAGTAEALLRTYTAPTEEWTLGVVPDASLELGDVVGVAVDNREAIQVVTGFSLPVGLSGGMNVSTRSLVAGGVS